MGPGVGREGKGGRSTNQSFASVCNSGVFDHPSLSVYWINVWLKYFVNVHFLSFDKEISFLIQCIRALLYLFMFNYSTNQLNNSRHVPEKVAWSIPFRSLVNKAQDSSQRSKQGQYCVWMVSQYMWSPKKNSKGLSLGTLFNYQIYIYI